MQKMFAVLIGLFLVAALTTPAEAAPARRAVKLSASDRSITVGEAIRLSGTVKPGAGSTAVVQRKVKGRWRTQARVAVRAGRYAHVVSPSTPKTHVYRVLVPRKGSYAKSVSRVVRVKVTRPKKRDLVTSEMRNARVPSLCGHPAGRLRNGSLPGIAQGQGEVTFVRAVFGELDGRRGRDAAVVMRCNAGGVGWPDQVLLYTANAKGKPTYRGTFDTFSVVKFGRESVRSIQLVARRVTVDAYAGEQWECMACGTVAVRATLKVSKGRLKVVSTSRYGAEEALRAFLAAANRGDVAAAKRMSIPTDGIHPAEKAIAAVRDGGALSPLPTYAGVGVTACEQLPLGGPAFTCEVENSKDHVTVMMSHKGWREWEVFEFFWYGD